MTTTRPIVHEVGLRDGLQMEQQTVPTEQKRRWVDFLYASGVDIIQVGSFVHPGKVPQMADTDLLVQSLLAATTNPPRVTLSALVLNEKGLERALGCGVGMICMGVSASETHSRKNTGMGVVEATERIIAIARRAQDARRSIQVSVQSAFGCGFEGPIATERVLSIVKRYLEAGLRTISLADTAGHATPAQVEMLCAEVRKLEERAELACHFHNTYGLGLANCYAALQSGVTTFESAMGGLGGCPFTKVAGGNVSTEDMVHMFHRLGLRRDIQLTPLLELAKDVGMYFEREMPGMVYKTGPIPEAQPAA
jgi:hydroxymethylglutaryl-CoA lyase